MLSATTADKQFVCRTAGFVDPHVFKKCACQSINKAEFKWVQQNRFIRSVEMECNQFQSVVALVNYLVRSTHARKSRVLLPDPPVRAPISSKSFTDFSVSRK